MASWPHDVQPVASGCGVGLPEAPREGMSLRTSSIRLMATEECYVQSAMGNSPFMMVPKAFIYNVLGRSHSSLLEFIQGAPPPCIQWKGWVPHFLILNKPRWKLDTNSQGSVCNPCTEFSWLRSRQALWHGTAVGDSPEQLWSCYRKQQEASTSASSLSFGSYVYTEAVAHLLSEAAAVPVAGYVPHWSTAVRLPTWCPPWPHTCLIAMVWPDDLDSWLNLVTVSGTALLVCFSALPLISEAAAPAGLADLGLLSLMEQPAFAAPQHQPAQLWQIWGLFFGAPKHNFFQVELQDQSRCLSKVGYSWDRICTFTGLDYNLTCFGEVTPFPELGSILPANTWFLCANKCH